MFRKQPIPLTRGRDSFTTGWVQPSEERLAQLRAEQLALRARLNTARDGEPVAYKGVYEFQPEKASFAVDYLQDGASSALCNYVVRDGRTTDVRIRVTGPGTFHARYLQVNLYKRLWAPLDMNEAISGTNPANENQLNYSSNVLWCPLGVTPGGAAPLTAANWTTKFCLFPRWPAGSLVPGAGSFGNYNAINFFWNMFDGRNNDYLADQMLSHHFLRPRTSEDQATVPVMDGGLFEFPVPWAFERDADVIFQFRPITPVLQFDSTIAGTDVEMGLAYDDRENGLRRQSVRLEVELLGETHITDQDIARSGARSTQRGVQKVK